jgi:hypothetical protein
MLRGPITTVSGMHKIHGKQVYHVNNLHNGFESSSSEAPSLKDVHFGSESRGETHDKRNRRLIMILTALFDCISLSFDILHTYEANIPRNLEIQRGLLLGA